MHARISDYALGLIILTEETESNLKVVREIARKSLLMSWHSKLVHSRRRRIFTREIWGGTPVEETDFPVYLRHERGKAEL